ncbi:uncharacterized protein LOC120359054 [Solenopsis invicta]|uniref:uncharacterized protein LOC120359054 n=1 Tax=Solenopsis invicta TaxID=13686 RepID=UPI00193DFF9F|nr:uncharacterized protein LOC120359054 [Solenopsis invicta]
MREWEGHFGKVLRAVEWRVRGLMRGREGVEEDDISMEEISRAVYATVLAERLREEVERKRILAPSQTGFRRGVGTIDQIYVLNYLINKRVAVRKSKMVVLFVDLKAAFDSVDREILIQMMRERGVRKSLVVRRYWRRP